MLRPRGACVAVSALLAVLAPASADAAPPAPAAPAAPAGAAQLEAAKTAVEASDYLKARAALTAALTSGANGREELAEIYRLSGIVAGALGDAKAATAAFHRALALSPKVALPPGTSPKIGRPFAAAQALAKDGAPLEIKSETASSPPSVTVVVAADPLGMIARVRAAVVVDGKAEQTFDRPASERTTIELPAGRRLDLRVTAIDEHGNRLAELGTREVPIVILGKGLPEAPPTRPIVGGPEPQGRPDRLVPARPRAPRPLYLKWWLWGGAAVAFGGAATFFGIDAMLARGELQALNRESVNHTYDEATSLESRARRGVLFANIGYGAAAAFAVTGAILYLTEPRTPRGERRVGLAPIHGGGALVLGGNF